MTSDASDAEQANKRFATLRARCALQGVVLHRSRNAAGETIFFATRDGECRRFETVNAAERFANEAEATNA